MLWIRNNGVFSGYCVNDYRHLQPIKEHNRSNYLSAKYNSDYNSCVVLFSVELG